MVKGDFKDNLTKVSLIYVSVFLIASQLNDKTLFEVMKTTSIIIVYALGGAGIFLFLMYSIKLQIEKKKDLNNEIVKKSQKIEKKYKITYKK